MLCSGAFHSGGGDPEPCYNPSDFTVYIHAKGKGCFNHAGCGSPP